MIIEELVHKGFPEEVEYEIIVSTDSTIERDLIKIHLAQAQEEYKNWLRKFTKGEKTNG
jgi:hypothetical protein